MNTSTYNLYAVSDGADSSVGCMGPARVWGCPSSFLLPLGCWSAALGGRLYIEVRSVAVCILKYTLWPFVYIYIEVHSVAVCILKYTLWPFVYILKYTLSPFVY